MWSTIHFFPPAWTSKLIHLWNQNEISFFFFCDFTMKLMNSFIKLCYKYVWCWLYKELVYTVWFVFRQFVKIYLQYSSQTLSQPVKACTWWPQGKSCHLLLAVWVFLCLTTFILASLNISFTSRTFSCTFQIMYVVVPHSVSQSLGVAAG